MVAKCITITIIQPKAVLTMDTVVSDKVTAQVGESFIVSATVRNTGTANGSATVTFKEGSETGTTVGSAKTQVIAPNSSVVIKSDSMVVDGDGTSLTICAVLTCAGC